MPQSALTVDGKFFRAGKERWPLRGISYGPLPGGYEDLARCRSDLETIRSLGFNSLRLYDIPPAPFLEDCARLDLCVFLTPPWPSHTDFLESRHTAREIRRLLTKTVADFKPYPAVAGYFVANEIPAPLVRWMGPRRVLRFLEDCLDHMRRKDPTRLYSYANYPSSEYLQPSAMDFLACNVYLEDREAFSRYLRRLQHLAGPLPLVVSEFGLDTLRHGAQRQAETLAWHVEECAMAGAAGGFAFTFTDAWRNAGHDVDDWAFGIVDRQRLPKAGAQALSAAWDRWFPVAKTAPPQGPRVSVVVCSHNGQRHLPFCLQALSEQSYAPYEILVVDDGSEPSLNDVVAVFHSVIFLRQPHLGLGAARNAGVAASRGELIAFTDDDCVPDREWLERIVRNRETCAWDAAGGPNLPPREESLVARTIQCAPGHPAHVMLDDVNAEHLAGCNLVVSRAAFEAAGGFRPQYRSAGDDVDFCWRLRDGGFRLGFVPGAFVWHKRRRSIRSYLDQQAGYGKAESFLFDDHRGRFDGFGRPFWQGRLYSDTPAASPGACPIIYFGMQATAPYQFLYGGNAGSSCGPWRTVLILPWALTAIVLLGAGVFLPSLSLAGALMLILTLTGAFFFAVASRVRPQPGQTISVCLLAFLILAQVWTRGSAFLFDRLWRGDAWRPFRAFDSFSSDAPQPQRSIYRALAEQEPDSRPRLAGPWSRADLHLEPGFWTVASLFLVAEWHAQQHPLLRLRLETGPRPIWLVTPAAILGLSVLLALAGHMILAASALVVALLFLGCLLNENRSQHSTLWSSIELAAAPLRSAGSSSSRG